MSQQLKTIQNKVPEWLASASSELHRTLRQAGAKRLPWFEQARQSMPAVVNALRDDYVLHLSREAELNQVLSVFPSLEAFAKPLLETAIKERFGLTMDVRETWLFHARRISVDDSFAGASKDPLIEYQKSLKAATQTLLHAALQNFESWEAAPGGMDLDARQKAALYDRYPVEGLALTGTQLSIAPEAFATLCRELDLGGEYQKKVSAFLNPVSDPGDAPDAAAYNRRGLLKRVESSALSIQVHLAFMQGQISHSLYGPLLEIAENGINVSADGKPVTCSFLRLWDIELTGIVAIGKARENADSVQSVVVYIPNDPVCPLKEYASSAAFTSALRDRLLMEGYPAFFQRFVPARHQAALFAKLEKCLRPVVWNKDRGWYEPQVDLNAKLHLREGEIKVGLLKAITEQKAAILKDDALFHAVPTAIEDQKTFDQRVHYFETVALQALNAVGFVVPPVGAVMMAVAAAQLGAEVFEGVDSWTRGEWEQGWRCLMDVAENVALMAALGAAHGSGAPAVETLTVETPSFIEELEEVELPNGETRLWKPDIAPFAHDIVLPAGLKPDAYGVYHYQNKTWVSLDDKVYSVKRSSANEPLRIEHPTKAISYEPPLRSNGAGALLHPADRPLEWEGLKLFRRLGHAAEAFSDVTARRILQVSDTHETVLRGVLAEHQRPPALLEDTMRRFQLDADVRRESQGEAGFDRTAEFASRYRALSFAREAEAGLITRRYPDLPSPIVDEVVRAASASERAALAHGQVPLRIAEEIRVYQQQVRLARAYEGLYLESVSNPDSDTLILHSLERLPDWPSTLRLEVRDQRLAGPLLDAIGPVDSTLRKVLVRHADGFQPYDEQGLELHGRSDFYAAVLHALPDAQRVALGFPGTWDGPKLQLAIQNGSLLPRPALRRLLKMQPVAPGRPSPMRLADGRLGYPLSGRGAIQGFIARDTLLDLIRSIGLISADVSAEQRLTMLEGAGLNRQQIHQRLIQALDERIALDVSLNAWGDGSASMLELEERQLSRTRIHEAIWRQWADTALSEATPNPSALRLQNVVLSDFPPALPDFFTQRVTRLDLIDVAINRTVATAPQPVSRAVDQRLALEAFMIRFPETTELEIRRTHPALTGSEPLVYQLPYLIAQCFPALRSLRLVNQSLSISLLEVQSLSRLEHLELLDLSGNTVSFIPPTNLTSLPLRHLILDNIGLDHWPAWLDGLATSTITELSLRYNRITEVPWDVLGSQTTTGTTTSLSFQGNPLSRLALTRIRLNEGPLSRFQFHIDVPPHLAAQIALLRQERTQLQEAIDNWTQASSSNQPLSEETLEVRRVIGETVLEFSRMYGEGQTQTVLTLQGVSLEDFPRQLPAFFYLRVRSLQLIRVRAGEVALNRFLTRFPQLTNLELTGAVEPLPALPSALPHMTQLTTLSIRNQGRLIDQQTMTFLARMPHLGALDLSGNELGVISDVSAMRGRLTWLSLDSTGLTQWPDWVDGLLPMEGLTLDNNQLSELPERILQNPRNDIGQTEIALRGNPLTHETMRRAHVSERYHSSYTFAMDLPDDILNLSPERHDSDSDDYESDSDSSGGLHSPEPPPPEETPDVEQWLLGSVDENQTHKELWQRLETRGDAPKLMALIGRLTQSAPYRNAQTRQGFSERVWHVLEAADLSVENRLLYNGIAEEALVQPETGFQTCHDGAWLVFNQIEIQMFIEQSLSNVPAELRGQSLYRLTQRLYRLNELDTIAREQAGGRDEAEVRLAYRLRWASELDLPLPPSNMLYQVHASIRPGELDAALARVQLGEHGEAFMRYAAQRDFWVEYLREAYAERFEALKEDYLAQVVALPDRFPGQTIDELGAEYAALKEAYEAQEMALIRELTYRVGFEEG